VFQLVINRNVGRKLWKVCCCSEVLHVYEKIIMVMSLQGLSGYCPHNVVYCVLYGFYFQHQTSGSRKVSEEGVCPLFLSTCEKCDVRYVELLARPTLEIIK